MLQIKPIQPDPWQTLKATRLTALADAPYAFGTTLAEAEACSDAEWQKRAQRFSEAPPAAGCIAFWDDVPCGMASAYPLDTDARTAGLTSFWVAPQQRGQGIADALVLFIAEWARAQSFARHSGYRTPMAMKTRSRGSARPCSHHELTCFLC